MSGRSRARWTRVGGDEVAKPPYGDLEGVEREGGNGHVVLGGFICQPPHEVVAAARAFAAAHGERSRGHD